MSAVVAAGPEAGAPFELRVLDSMTGIAPQRWDALLGPRAGPLVRHSWLEALERCGASGADSTWRPAHLVVERAGTLVAAVPRYRRTADDAEWVWHAAVADGAARMGVPGFPRDVSMPPLTPVPGERLLVGPGTEEERRARKQVAARALLHLARTHGSASVHLQFLDAEDLTAIETMHKSPFLLRRDEQHVFRGGVFASFGQWLDSLPRKRRQTVRAERRAAAMAGIGVRWVDGVDAEPGLFGWMAALYASTARRHGMAGTFLPLSFFDELERRCRPLVRFAVGTVEGKDVACAMFAEADGLLTGRYWGAEVDLPNLHFEVAIHSAIERVIERGLVEFNPGHGGEHKRLRGLAEEEVVGAHHFSNPRLHRAVADWERRVRAAKDAERRA